MPVSGNAFNQNVFYFVSLSAKYALNPVGKRVKGDFVMPIVDIHVAIWRM